MTRRELILDRYEPLGTAGSGGFGTVQVAWDPRIQRKVAIKTIQLSELDARRALLPGADAVGGGPGSRPGDGSAAGSAQRPGAGYGSKVAPGSGYGSEATPGSGRGSRAALGSGRGSKATPDAFEPDSLRDRWHGLEPWGDYLKDDLGGYPQPYLESSDDGQGGSSALASASAVAPAPGPAAAPEPVTALAHLPGLDEARTAAKLSDSRIVGVYDFEVRGQVAYLIMEYIEGATLTRLLDECGDYFTLDVVAAVFDAVAGALAVAHKAGVLHLDIKPDNIIVNLDGQAKVTDFGLATLADAAGSGTAGGGTIGYMPLEQMRREPLDARTDEWSLAAVLYEMLTGANEFRAHDLAGAERAIEDAELVLPSLCWDNADEGIDDVVFRALDPDPERRYATVAAFAKAADAFLGDAREGQAEIADMVADVLGLAEEAEPEPGLDPDAPAAPAGPPRIPWQVWAAAVALALVAYVAVAFLRP